MEGFRRVFLGILKCVIFLIILVLSLVFINKMLEPKYYYYNSLWPTTSTYEYFYEMEENSIDVLFLGSSVCVNAFSPQEMYDSYGVRSYNLGSEQQSVMISYYWLKEALRFQSPKVVILDLRFCNELHPESLINTTEPLTRKCIDPMKLSDVKREAVREICRLDPSQSELSYYFTNMRFHNRWKNIEEIDINNNNLDIAQLKGYAPGRDPAPEYYETYSYGGGTDAAEMQPVMMDYLKKMAALCTDEGIRFIMINLPGNPTSDEINNTFTRFANANRCYYYNFCDTSWYNAIGAKLPKESIVNHSNYLGAIVISRFMAKSLVEAHGVKPAYDEQYEETKEFYVKFLENEYLRTEEDVVRYLKGINKSRYVVFMAVKGDIADGMTDEIRNALKALGLEKIWDEDMLDKGYCAVIDEGSVKEEAGGTVSTYGTVYQKEEIYSMVSSGNSDGAVCSVNIKGTECSMNMPGLNIVVYDTDTRNVIDTVAFDIDRDEVYR